MTSKPKLFVAAKAFIFNKGKILLLKESSNYQEGVHAQKFDVVGGRLEPGEDFYESALREIKEETGLNVKIGNCFFVNESRPTVNGEQWQIVRVFLECFSDSEEVILSEDHNEYLWIKPEDYKNHAVIENLHPAFEAFLNK